MKKRTIEPAIREKAMVVDHLLQKHYGAPFNFFSTKDALSELVKSILSHRTKNKVSSQAYYHLREVLPTWEAVRDAPEVLVQEAIKAVTYPEVKAPRIQNALRLITESNNGQLTLDFIKEMTVKAARTWLEKIPGVGIKTSAAILNFSELQLPALVVDMHHLRVAQRVGIVPIKCTLDKGARMLEAYLPEDWDGQQVFDSHQGFMRHGQKICHWDKPDCENCVIVKYCDYYQNKIKTLLVK